MAQSAPGAEDKKERLSSVRLLREQQPVWDQLFVGEVNARTEALQLELSRDRENFMQRRIRAAMQVS